MGRDDFVAHTWRCRDGGASLLLVVRGICKGRCVVVEKKKKFCRRRRLQSADTSLRRPWCIWVVRIDEQLALLACILGQAKQLRASLSLSLSLSLCLSVFFVSFFCGATFRSFGVCAAKHNFVFAFFIFCRSFGSHLRDVDNGETTNCCWCCLDASHKELKYLRRRRRPRPSPTGFCSKLQVVAPSLLVTVVVYAVSIDSIVSRSCKD